MGIIAIGKLVILGLNIKLKVELSNEIIKKWNISRGNL